MRFDRLTVLSLSKEGRTRGGGALKQSLSHISRMGCGTFYVPLSALDYDLSKILEYFQTVVVAFLRMKLGREDVIPCYG